MNQSVFFFLFYTLFSLSSLSFQLPYFVILWSLLGGNFCAGYDLKMLANEKAALKLESDVRKDPGPMVSRSWVMCLCDCAFLNDVKEFKVPTKYK